MTPLQRLLRLREREKEQNQKQGILKQLQKELKEIGISSIKEGKEISARLKKEIEEESNKNEITLSEYEKFI